jgi:hypothetical protein
MKSAFWRVSALVFALALVSAAAVDFAHAGLPGEVAHSAMEGSTLMRTTAQFNSWTHWIVNHENFVELDTGLYESEAGSPSEGQATLHWKYNDSNHLLFRVRRDDLGGQNSNFLWGGSLGSQFFTPEAIVDAISVSSRNAYDMGQMLNLAWARQTGGGGAFSIGVLYGRDSEKQDVAPTVEDGSQAFGGQFTWGNGAGIDIAASFFNESGKFEETDASGAATTDLESSFLNADLTVRIDRNQNWIWQFGGVFGNGKNKDNAAGSEDKLSLFGVIGNVGKYLLDANDGAVTAEFYAAYLNSKIDNNQDSAEDKTSTFVVPGMRVAAWHDLSSKFQLMAGADAFWVIDTNDVKDDTGADSEKFSENTMDFSWAAGLAFMPMDNLRLEGEFNINNLDNILSLGNSDPLFFQLGGTLTF